MKTEIRSLSITDRIRIFFGFGCQYMVFKESKSDSDTGNYYTVCNEASVCRVNGRPACEGCYTKYGLRQ